MKLPRGSVVAEVVALPVVAALGAAASEVEWSEAAGSVALDL
jgi:hypothetical protein